MLELDLPVSTTDRIVIVGDCPLCGSAPAHHKPQRLAAALRREAHEIDHDHVSGVDDSESDAEAERLRERADRLDGSGP